MPRKIVTTLALLLSLVAVGIGAAASGSGTQVSTRSTELGRVQGRRLSELPLAGRRLEKSRRGRALRLLPCRITLGASDS
jgi:hypothetical protein